MRRRRWRGSLSSADQAELWRRWRQGDAVNAIARALDRRRSVVQRVLAGTGGFTPVLRRRSPRVLSLAEREEISRGVAGGQSVRQIAGLLGRAPSTVCRELGRHGGRTRYRAALMPRHGSWPGARRCVSSPPSPDYGLWSLRSSSRTGRRNRSPAGSATRFRRTSGCTCRTRPSTGACSSRHAGC